MVFGVGHIQRIADEFHPLRMVESGGSRIAVGKPLNAAADNGLRCAVQVGNDDAVVVGVGDEQSVAGAVGQHFAGEGQRGIGNGVGLEVERPAVNQPLRVKLGNHPAQQVVKSVIGQLALVLADNLAGGVNEHQRWPGAAGVLLPHLELGIVDDGMLELVALGGQQHIVGVLFVGELGRMDADDHQLGGVFFLEFPQLRKNVHTIDSTVSPEIQHDHLAAQVSHSEGAVGVEPFHAVGKVGGVDGAGERAGGSHSRMTSGGTGSGSGADADSWRRRKAMRVVSVHHLARRSCEKVFLAQGVGSSYENQIPSD